MTTHDDPTGPSSRRRSLAALLLVGVLFGTSCSGSDAPDEADVPTTSGDAEPDHGALPTLAGGLELAAVEPVRVLTGDGLAYGQPLPSQQAAAQAFLEEPEVAAATARQIYSLRDGRLIGEALVLELDGAELFDESVLDAFLRGMVTAVGGEEQEDVELGGRTVVRSRGPSGTTIAYVEGNVLSLARGADDHDVGVVVERQLAGLAAGLVGAADPRTPLVPLAVDAAFVRVPTVAFQPIPPPEEEPVPEAPTLAGASGVQGRYGVVAGERRSTVWAFTVDPATYPWAEPLEGTLPALASSRAGGAPAEADEVLGRVVHRADGAADAPSARAFRHGGLVLVVEGPDPEQLDAVVSAWIAALAAP